MTPDRRRTLLFLACAIVLLGAGYTAGSAHAYGRFYSSEALIDRELLHMDFNSRLLHYTILGRQADCRRELVGRLQGEVALVNQQLAGGLPADDQANARTSVENARTVMGGHPLTHNPPTPPSEKARE